MPRISDNKPEATCCISTEEKNEISQKGCRSAIYSTQACVYT